MDQGIDGEGCAAGARWPIPPGRAAVGETVEGGPLGHGQRTTVADSADEAAPARPLGPGDSFGDYELLGELGSGGMGVVYRARQVSLGRFVALKLLRPGAPTGRAELRRFRNEAEVVATMDHPNIVPIYEVGRHDGHDYFGMKLIEGPSLEKRLKQFGGDYRASARLVASVADAVDHAHRRGVLHRDLKPANILVDGEGRPLVTDFGLAKRLADDAELTAPDAIAGTPAYMAPEQAVAGTRALTTSADVYGLGAILYALLSGRAPFRGTSALDVLGKVREAPPEPPSRSDRRVPRDLEAICLKCLEKAPSRRYASAEALAEDLRRWLDNRPTRARPSGPATRLAKWCRRKPALAGLSAALAAAVVVGLAGIFVNWREARQQRERAVREWGASRALNYFLTERLLPQASPLMEARRRGVTVEEALDLAARSVGDDFAGHPKHEAAIRLALGEAYRALGDLTKAEAQLSVAARLGEAMPVADELDRLATAHAIAGLRLDQGRAREAVDLANRARDGRIRLLGPGDTEALDSTNTLAAGLRAAGRKEEAEALLRDALPLCEADLARAGGTAPPSPADRPAGGPGPTPEPASRRTSVALGILHNLATRLQERGAADEAEEKFVQVVAARVRLQGPDHPETLYAEGYLAMLRMSRGLQDEAEEALRRVVEGLRRSIGEDGPKALDFADGLGSLLVLRSKLPEAEALLRDTLRRRRAVLGDRNPATARSLNNLAIALERRDDLAGAEPLLREALDIRRSALPPADPHLAQSLISLAGCLADRGGMPEARALLEEAGRIEDDPRGERDGAVDRQALLGRVLVALGESARAEPLLRAAVRRRAAASPGSWQLAKDRSLLGECLSDLGVDAEAEPLLVDGYRSLRSSIDAPPRRVAQARKRVVRFYESRRRDELASRFRAEATAPPEGVLSPPPR